MSWSYGYEMNEGDIYILTRNIREEVCAIVRAWTLEPDCLALNPGFATYWLCGLVKVIPLSVFWFPVSIK